MQEKWKRWLPAIILALTIPLLVWGILSSAKQGEESVVAEVSLQDGFSEERPEDKTSALQILSPKEQVFTQSEPTLHIEGKTNPRLLLTINGETITVAEDGNFTYLLNLAEGENVFIISDGVQSLEYRVTYAPHLFFSVSPTKNILSGGNEALHVSAKAKEGSQVTATLSKETITLVAGKAENGVQIFTGEFTLPAQSSVKQNLGRIKFRAENGSNQQSVQGAAVSISARPLPDIPIEVGTGTVKPPQVQGDRVEVLQPTQDYGRGPAKVLEIQTPYAETAPSSNSGAKSTPNATPLVNGTYDYIVDTKVYDNDEYYVTKSGLLVEAEKCKSFDGFVLPTNTVSLKSGGNADLVLTMNWKVPFQSQMKPQKYHAGYQGRKFNVSAFDAEYIDFTFYYTNAAEGEVQFPKSSVVSSAKWVSKGAKDGTSTLRVYFRNKGFFYGYHAYYGSDNRLHISFTEPHKTSPKVVLDIGHGGKDCGAIGANGVYESIVTLHIGSKVYEKLRAKGIRVELTRGNDTFVSLDARQQKARDVNANLFVSLHANSAPPNQTKWMGPELYYYRAFAKAPAQRIENQLLQAYKEIYKEDPQALSRIIPSDGGVRYYPYKVTRLEECPAVLVECGYLSNPTECAALCDAANQERLAQAIADGIAEYFQKDVQ